MTELAAVETSSDVPIYRESFEGLKERIRAVPIDKLRTVNVDPLFALRATRRAMPNLKAMRSRLIEDFTRFDAQQLDDLPALSQAFAHATTLLRAAEPQGEGVETLAQECSETRTKLEAYLRAAIEAGVVSTSRLDELKGTVGHRNTAHDLLFLAQLYRANWSKLEGKCFFTAADIRHADVLAKRLNDALADRDTRSAEYEEANLDRQRIFTLFFEAYTRVRRFVKLLLEEDGKEHLLEDVMPSIHTPHASKRGEEPAATPAPSATASPAVDTIVAPRKPYDPSRIGMPDSEPFLPQ